jgi:hypothetical protein
VADSKFLRGLWREGGDSLERWTNAHLDNLHPPQSLDGALAFLSRVDRALDLMETPSDELRKYVVQRRDEVTKSRDDEDRQAKVTSGLMQGLKLAGLDKVEKPKRGRPKGSAPRLAEADADVARIGAFWKDIFGMASPQCPSAIEIAARRHGLEPGQLENFRKNRSKLRAGK